MKRIRMPRPGTVLGVVAVILALAGTAVAASNLRLANFEPSSRDRLAGTGVIQYAAQTHSTGTPSPDAKTFSVQCAAEKKATAGGFKWLGTPPIPTDYQFVDEYPTIDSLVLATLSQRDLVPAAAAATIATIEGVIDSPVGEGDVEPMTWGLAERGRATSAVEFVQRRDELGALTRFAATWWGEGFDLLLTPTVQAPAPALGELMEGDPATLLQRQLRWFPLTPFANVSGQPAISVPVDPGADALPVGVQLIAALGREDVLIRVAAQLELAMPWRGVAPAFALRP